jgi:hypothetical protein
MADDIIEIRDKEVRLYRKPTKGRRKLDRSVSLSSFLGELSASAYTHVRDSSPLLPQGTRLAMIRGLTTMLAVEQAPQVRRLLWDLRPIGEDDPYRERVLAFPYVIYVILFYHGSFEEMRVFYRNGPLESAQDLLCFPNLLNVQASPGTLSNCRACMRGTPRLGDQSLALQTSELINYFWTTGFNIDVEQNSFWRAQKIDPRIVTVDAWEQASQHDPLFVLEIPWESTGFTLQQIMESLMSLRISRARRLEQASDVADLIYRLPPLVTE